MSHANEKKEKESTQSSDNSNDQDDTENVYQSSQTNHNSTQWSEDEPIKAGGGKRARNRIFQANTLLQGGTIHNKSDKEKLYTSAISIIALFSWVMRKDEGADDEELDVAQLYFEKHPAFNRILRLFPNGLEKDPITGAEHISVENCMQMLKFYNTCPRMLRYAKCCSNILSSGIYYMAALDLMKALLQVAYTIDGVIAPEWEILRGIAQELKILKADWMNLEQKYTQMGRSHSSSKRKSSRGNNNSEKGKSGGEQSKRQENNRSQGQQQKQQQDQTKKSSTFGYKLTQAYNQLGILTTATEPEIKAAFRQLAKKYHPDRLPSDATDMDRKISADQFRQVMEAYDLIRLEKGM
jgi:DnaJ-domain-containing protein 1